MQQAFKGVRLLPTARPHLVCRAISASSHSETILRTGDVVQLNCADFAVGGDGVCKLEDGFVVFVPRALPGEAFSAKITSVKKGFARAEKLEILRPHDNSTTPECPHFGPCGGCTLQSLNYTTALKYKEHQVASLMQRIAGVQNVENIMKPILGCDKLYNYRNKMEFSFDSRTMELGLHKPGSHDRILSLTQCSLQTEFANEIFAEIKHIVGGLEIARPKKGNRGNDYPRRGGTGGGRGGNNRNNNGGRAPLQLLQSVVIRHSVAEDKYLVNIVTARNAQDALKPVAAALRSKFGSKLAGVVNTVLEKGRPKEERRIAKECVLEGQGYLIEKLHGVEYRVSPNAFFQVNTQQAEHLFDLVLTAAELRSTDTALDLYCGGGAITLLLAKQCKSAHGIEISESSVEDAKKNALRNKIINANFTCSDASITLSEELKAVDVVVVDPARPGLSSEVIQSIRSTAARRLVYVSCNPSTQARDIAALCDEDGESAAFKLMSVQPVDMYPQTAHVESVAVLDRVNVV